jgi:hypothetical protein
MRHLSDFIRRLRFHSYRDAIAATAPQRYSHVRRRSVLFVVGISLAAIPVAPSEARCTEEACSEPEETLIDCPPIEHVRKTVWVNVGGGSGQVGTEAGSASYRTDYSGYGMAYYKPDSWNSGKASDGSFWTATQGSEWAARCICSGGWGRTQVRAASAQDRMTMIKVKNAPPNPKYESGEGCGDGEYCEPPEGGPSPTREGTSSTFTYVDPPNYAPEVPRYHVYCDIIEWYEEYSTQPGVQYYVDTEVVYCWREEY